MKATLVREELAALVAANTASDVAVVDTVPDQVAVPAVLVAWADPWFTPDTFCAWTLRPTLLIIAGRLEPGAQLGRLEELVSDLLPPLRASHTFTVDSVAAPFPAVLAGVTYLATSIALTVELQEN